MPLSELEPILNKDSIIATYPAQFLRTSPAVVEEVYRAHARTHISLGDTARYVDTIFKWVGGTNKGAFIGGVVGEHGHGKTSFQVHVWHESARRGIMAVPPFSWDRVSDIIEGAAAWVHHILSSHDLDIAREADLIYQEYREKSLHEVAERTAQKTGKAVDEVLVYLRDVSEHGGATVDTAVSPDRVLDYFEAVTNVVRKAGFQGFMVLLDEPEVAARRLGNHQVSQILFDFANGLLQRQGDYGLFISLPERFLASATKLFPSLTARLQDRNCLPRLRNIYGSDFAQVLWERFVSEFHLSEEDAHVLSPESLRAIGQVSSSERSDLSYGPRTVVSAFRRSVRRYVDEGVTYSPYNFVDDCLRDEIRVSPDYPTRVQTILSAAHDHGLDRHSMMILAAFPNGISVTEAEAMGINGHEIELARRVQLLYKRGNIVGLVGLRMEQGAGADTDELRDAVDEIFGEFAPRTETFGHAKDAFEKYVIPKVFEEQKGQQFLGWNLTRPWKEIAGGIKFAEFEGAFRETEKDYPARRIVVGIGPLDYDIPPTVVAKDNSDPGPDIVLKFCLRWNREASLPDRLVEITVGDPEQQIPGTIRVTLDLAGEPLTNVGSVIEELAEKELLTPLGILNLMDELDRRTLSKEYKLAWEALREPLVREVTGRFFASPALRSQIEGVTQLQVPAGAQGLVGSMVLWVLRNRYNEYSTLMRQPHWTKMVDTYIRALGLQEIPPAAKRARESWVAPTQTVARAFGTNSMNLNDALSSYSNLISIRRMAGRDGETEVTFKLHLLEEKIREAIMSASQERRLKFEDGETNWWVYADDMMRPLLSAGYSLLEITKIVEMGEARGSFTRGRDRQKPVFYCLPLDIDQMKIQLRDKLTALKQESDALQFVPEYRSSFDFAAVSTEIESMMDLAQFEGLASRINKEFVKNHNALPTYYDSFVERLRTESADVQRIKQQLSDSRQVAGLQTLPSGVSKWSADLSQYVVLNLQTMVQDIRRDCVEVSTAAEKAVVQLSGSQSGQPMEKLTALQDAWNTLQAVKVKAGKAKTASQDLKGKLDDYDSWRKLLTQSDATYTELLDLKQEPSHSGKADELLQALQAVWNEISHHLATRGVVALGSYQQFTAKIEKVAQDRKTYLRDLKGVFDQQKEQLNALLVAVGLSEDARCTEQYNPMDAAGSASRLTEQAVAHVQAAITVERNDLASQRQELLYTRDVLKWLGAEQAEPLLNRIASGEASLSSVAVKIDKQWILDRKLSSDGQVDSEAAVLKSSLAEAREISRTARQAIRGSRPEDSTSLSPAAEELLGLVPPNEAVNIKQLILTMIAHGRDSREVLETALNGLAELFRQDKVQIKVELPRK